MVLAVITTLITHHRTDKITKLLLTTGMRHRRLAKDRTSVITLSVPEMVAHVIRRVLRHRALVRRLFHSNVLRSHRLQDQLALHRVIRQLRPQDQLIRHRATRQLRPLGQLTRHRAIRQLQLQLLLIGIRHRHHAIRQLQLTTLRLQLTMLRLRLITMVQLRFITMVLRLVPRSVRGLCILIRLSFLTDILRSCTTTADRIVRPCTRMLTIS